MRGWVGAIKMGAPCCWYHKNEVAPGGCAMELGWYPEGGSMRGGAMRAGVGAIVVGCHKDGGAPLAVVVVVVVGGVAPPLLLVP